jgi:hypothetical protein
VITQGQMDFLAARASAAGHDSIASYCLALHNACSFIGNEESGIWGARCREALYGPRPRRPVDRASRAVAQRGHAVIDEQLTDTIAKDNT